MTLTDPIWDSPGGMPMKLAATAPKYGWTDLVYSLVPTGKHSQLPGALPAFDGSDSTAPIGIPKQSDRGRPVRQRQDRHPAGQRARHLPGRRSTRPSPACSRPTRYETNPLCATHDRRTRCPRSSPIARPTTRTTASRGSRRDPDYRMPVFNAATFTDPLFTPVENRRMANRLLSDRARVPDPAVLRRLPALRPEQGQGVGRHLRRRPPRVPLLRLPGRRRERDSRRPCAHRGDHAPEPLHRPLRAAAGQPELSRRRSSTSRPRFRSARRTPPASPPTSRATRSPPAASRRSRRARCSSTWTATRSTTQRRGAQHARGQRRPGRELRRRTAAAARSSTEHGGTGRRDLRRASRWRRPYTMIGATSVSIDYSATAAQGLQLNARLYDVLPDGTAVMVDRGVRRVDAARAARSPTSCTATAGASGRPPGADRDRAGRRPVPEGLDRSVDDHHQPRDAAHPGAREHAVPAARGRDPAAGAARGARTSRAPRRTASTARRWRSRRATRRSSRQLR